jgi:hypothetical protein
LVCAAALALRAFPRRKRFLQSISMDSLRAAYGRRSRSTRFVPLECRCLRPPAQPFGSPPASYLQSISMDSLRVVPHAGQAIALPAPAGAALRVAPQAGASYLVPLGSAWFVPLECRCLRPPAQPYGSSRKRDKLFAIHLHGFPSGCPACGAGYRVACTRRCSPTGRPASGTSYLASARFRSNRSTRFRLVRSTRMSFHSNGTDAQ